MGIYHDPALARDPDPIRHDDFVRMSIGSGPSSPSACEIRAFGTAVAFSAYGQPAACQAAFEEAIAACRRYERRLSTRLPNSDIARLNESGGEACAVHPQTAALIRCALRYCERSWGIFDVTAQPAVRLWDFEHELVPDEDELSEAASHVDWHGLHVFEEAGCCFAQLEDPQAAVDLGGIAKGWIADELVGLFGQQRWGLDGYVVNLGGNVAVGGARPDGSPWTVGLRDPWHPKSTFATLEVCNGAVVTSGTYERCFEKDGVLYHHVLDTATGMPVKTDLASATVVAGSAIDAEGYSTTLLALGKRSAVAFVCDEPAIERAVLVGADATIAVCD